MKESIEKEMKPLISIKEYQMHIRKKMCLQAFNETIEDAIKRKFKEQHVIV